MIELFRPMNVKITNDILLNMNSQRHTRQFFLATCNCVSSCLVQEKSPPITLLVCKIIRLQVIQQLAYVYNSTEAWNIFFTQICVPSCKKKLPRVTWPLVLPLILWYTVFFWLHNIKRISKFLSRDNLVPVIHAFIT